MAKSFNEILTTKGKEILKDTIFRHYSFAVCSEDIKVYKSSITLSFKHTKELVFDRAGILGIVGKSYTSQQQKKWGEWYDENITDFTKEIIKELKSLPVTKFSISLQKETVNSLIERGFDIFASVIDGVISWDYSEWPINKDLLSIGNIFDFSAKVIRDIEKYNEVKPYDFLSKKLALEANNNLGNYLFEIRKEHIKKHPAIKAFYSDKCKAYFFYNYKLYGNNLIKENCSYIIEKKGLLVFFEPSRTKALVIRVDSKASQIALFVLWAQYADYSDADYHNKDRIKSVIKDFDSKAIINQIPKEILFELASFK